MRTWLKDKYPNGIGLGDLMREHDQCYLQTEKEALLRRAEIRSIMNYMYTIAAPVFKEDFDGKVYFEED